MTDLILLIGSGDLVSIDIAGVFLLMPLICHGPTATIRRRTTIIIGSSFGESRSNTEQQKLH